MATVSKGRTFVSGETVTPAKLNELVDNATITFATASDTDDSTLEVAGGKFRVKDAGVTTAKLASDTQQGLIPAGAVMPFAMNSAPSGWLAADGAAVSRTTYAALFAAIGTAHGSGDGSTTFNLPDLRGIFVRGSGSQTISGTTYSGTFAAKQQDELKAHTHTYLNTSGGAGSGGVNPLVQLVASVTTNTGSTGGTETRPANIALLYCIKF